MFQKNLGLKQPCAIPTYGGNTTKVFATKEENAGKEKMAKGFVTVAMDSKATIVKKKYWLNFIDVKGKKIYK